MESIYGEMPAPIAAARKVGWVRYADHADLRSGRTADVAQRVLKRARRGRVLLVAVIVVYGGFQALELLHGRPDLGLLYPIAAAGVLLPKLQRMIRGLEHLAAANEAV